VRRTFGRTSFAVSLLLGKLGMSGSTLLLEGFGDVKPKNVARPPPDPTGSPLV
jgi:hypothetical protein